MRLHALLLSVIASIVPVLAIFADDAYHIDYHQALLGVPQSQNTFFLRPQTSSSASLLYTISKKAVLGAINPKDGSIVWRHALAGEPVSNGTSARLVAAEGDGKVISSFGQYVTAWDALDGKLVWAEAVASNSRVLGLEVVPSLNRGPIANVADVISLAGDEHATGSATTITKLAGEDGTAIWEYSDNSGDIPILISTSAAEVYFVSKHPALIGSGKVKVTVLDIKTGKQTKQYSLSADPDVVSVGRHFCVSSSTSSPFLAWSEKPFRALKTNLLGTSKVSTLNFEGHDGEEVEDISVHFPHHFDALPHFLVHLRSNSRQWADIFHLDIQSGDVFKAYSLPSLGEESAFAASNIDANVYFTRSTETEILLYSSASHGALGRWPRHRKVSGKPSHTASEVVSRGKSGFAIRVAETSTFGEWALVRNGETVWARPEMLASIVAAAWVDDMHADAAIHDIEEEVQSNPLNAYLHRVRRHANDLTALPRWLQNLPQSMLSSLSASNEGRDRSMMGSKTLIAATSDQYLLALDGTKEGAIKWIQDEFAENNGPHAVKSLYVHGEHVTVYLSDGSVGAILNATDGNIIGHKTRLPTFEKMIQVSGTSGPVSLRVSADGTPQVAEDFNISAPIEGNSIVTISDQGQAFGWTIGESIRKLWTLKPGSGFKLVNTVGRARHDPVASIGNVLGDRSVLYKYLSPNLVLLTASSLDTLTMYLIDAVTGAVLYTSTHDGVDPHIPIASVMSENWFAYSFLATSSSNSATGYQLIITELYESDVANDRGVLGSARNYSSFDPGAIRKPYAISQAFTIPEQVGFMAATQTNQGITSRQLLCTLPKSNSIVGIPRHILAPRRPVDREATALEAEEGLFKYAPSLDFDPKWIITHSREVLGIQKVISTPSLLESTSLAFAYGHDIFGTKLSPSMKFDVLDKGFNKVQLLLTVAALAAGTSALAPLVRKKQVDSRWRGQ